MRSSTLSRSEPWKIGPAWKTPGEKWFVEQHWTSLSDSRLWSSASEPLSLNDSIPDHTSIANGSTPSSAPAVAHDALPSLATSSTHYILRCGIGRRADTPTAVSKATRVTKRRAHAVPASVNVSGAPWCIRDMKV